MITDVVGIVNNVVTTTEKQAETSPDDAPHLNDILEAFEEQVIRIADSGENFEPIIESNVALSSTTKESATEGRASLGLNFAVLMDGGNDKAFTSDSILIYENKSDIYGVEVRSSISLPASIFDTQDNGRC